MANTSLQLAENNLSVINILLVEDNNSDASIITELLESCMESEYMICHVSTCEQAIKVLENNKFNVCLLDLSLPDIKDFSGLIDIQEIEPNMPVLILTGIRDTVLAKRAVARGAQDYLLKDDLEKGFLSRSIDYAIERKQLEMSLFKRANYDALTNIANRIMFMDRLQQALARGERSRIEIAVLFIDIDKFKPVNDQYGHDVGDEVLKTIANRIKLSIRSYDTPARFGGDEFAVLLENIDNPRDAASIAQKIINEITIPIIHNGKKMDIGASIGIVFVDMPILPETLLQHADIAMYSAKRDGGNRYRFYVENMHNEVSSELTVEDDLRTALANGELEVYYQPYSSIGGSLVLGVEALLRWRHPDNGLLCADDFLDVAEKSHLMPEITQFVTSQLYHDIAMFNAQIRPIKISINFSASQLEASNLINSLKNISDKDFLSGNSIIIEVNETSIAQISGQCFMILAKLYEMGIGLHLDHFGMNIVPLTTLCELPFSVLKIDSSLIKNMSKNKSDNIPINAAIMLAHQLEMKISAVGVENKWQIDMLKEQGCDIVQGAFIAEPMSAKSLVEWLGNRL